MAPSKRRKLFALLSAMLTSSLLACNALLGISDYDRGECSGGGVCADGGPGVFFDAKDTSTIDAPIDIVKDAAGTRPVSWAHFPMPNYVQDGGPTKPLLQFTPTGGGYIEASSNLVWREPMAPADKGQKTWDEANAICAAIPDNGKWRLPSRIELVTLLDLGRTSGAKTDPIFVSAESIEYWTLSEVRTVSGVTSDRWTVDFNKGGLGKKNINGDTAGVRCIKDNAQ